MGVPSSGRLREFTLRPLKLCHLKRYQTVPLSLHLRGRQLSLGLTALERGKNPHLPASPICILAVTSTPALNSEGQSEELGSDGVTPPPYEGGFSIHPPAGVGPEISGRIWGDDALPHPPQGSDDPPTHCSHLSQNRSDCDQAPTLLAGGGGGRSGRQEGGRPRGNVN